MEYKLCWRKQGCVFNSNLPSFLRCRNDDYPIERCMLDNYESHSRDKLIKIIANNKEE